MYLRREEWYMYGGENGYMREDGRGVHVCVYVCE